MFRIILLTVLSAIPKSTEGLFCARFNPEYKFSQVWHMKGPWHFPIKTRQETELSKCHRITSKPALTSAVSR